MKKIKLLSMVFGLLAATVQSSYAQPNVYATTADNFLLSGHIDPNSAIIDYTPNCSCGSALLTAIVSNASLSTGVAKLMVNDGVNTPVTLSLSINALDPDVIIGNNTTTSTNYLIGVVYRTKMTSNIVLAIYEVVQPGTASFAVNFVSTTNIATSKTAGNCPHIDVIAEYGNTFLGLPLCDKFVITYREGSPTQDVYGYYASLNSPSSGTYSSSIGSASPACDVAAIQRYNSGTSTVDDIALFVYIEPTAVQYREWNISQNTYSSVTSIDAGANPLSLRIDAIDDYNINGNGDIAQWCVAAASFPGVRVYSNLLGYGGYNISTGSYNDDFAAITNGPCSAYTVSYWSPDSTDDIITQTIDWYTGIPANGNYYQVNKSPLGTYYASRSSVSATCNSLGSSYAQDMVVCWPDGSLDLYNKYSTCGMGFKPASSITATVKPLTQPSLAPNPTNDKTTLSFTLDEPGSVKVVVLDAIGRVINTIINKMNAGSQQVAIATADLPVGVYTVSLDANKSITTLLLSVIK